MHKKEDSVSRTLVCDGAVEQLAHVGIGAEGSDGVTALLVIT